MSAIKLINTTGEVPKEFYVFVNTKDAIVKNNIEITKCMLSAAFSQLSLGNESFIRNYLTGNLDYLNYHTEGRFVSMYFAQPKTKQEWQLEHDCELYRKQNFPLYPSRLSACYAFGDYETCLHVSRKYGWDINTVKKFRLEETFFNRVAKVNMEIISLGRSCYLSDVIRNSQTQNNLWKSYWTGEESITMNPPNPEGGELIDSGIIWEYLIEGKLLLIEN